jgi:uncharacterized protein
MHVQQIVELYEAPLAEFRHRAMLINVNRMSPDTDMQTAVSFAWKVDVARARKAEVILATVRGMIRGAYIADAWKEATTENFPGRPTLEGRYGFIGHEAPGEMQAAYLNKRVPDRYRRRGSANPIRYVEPLG